MADTGNEEKVVLNTGNSEDVKPSDVTQEAASINDPLSNRDTDTGNMKKMLDDTKTRKTVKLKPLTGRKPIANLGGDDSDVPSDPLSNRDTDTGSMKSDIADTRTRKTVKLKPLTGKKPITDLSAPAPAAGKDESPLSDPLSNRDTDTGNMKKMLDDTKTRKTVKLKPLSGKTARINVDDKAGAAKPVVPEASASVDDTVALQRPKAAPLKPAVPGSKETIKLRPSTGGAQTPPAASDSGAATIKLNVPGEKSSSSKETIKLTPKSDAAKPAGLSIPKKPKAATPPPAPGDAEAPAEAAEPAKKGGLSLKKHDGPTAAPPSAAKGEEEFADVKSGKAKKRKGAAQASAFYTILALASLVLIGISVYISAAQYISLWGKEKGLDFKLDVPVINDYIEKIK